MKKTQWIAIALVTLTLAACATSPLGRRQLLLMPAAQMDQMGLTAYSQLKQQTPLSTNQQQIAYVRCISNALTATLAGGNWEINLFEDPTANAFALPGGFMGVHTGLLRIAQNQDQLAAVIGHEIGHVLAQHSNERVSIESATNTGMQLVQALSGEASPEKDMLFAALGVGAKFGVSMPFSRKHEAEADIIGLELMAKAGFDPYEAARLWENMSAGGGKQPPEFMSTHPSNETRINGLNSSVPKVLPYYEQARAAGRVPRCG